MSTPPESPVQPTRDQRATLGALVDVLLNKGVYLNLDLVITVADIPLIGINLRATIAGMETMLEHGMMTGWDERTRAWARQSVADQLGLPDGEDVLARMPGGYHDPGPASGSAIWRMGIVLVTTHRLIVFRREPPEVLWQSARTDIASVAATTSEAGSGHGERTRIEVRTTDGATVVLQASRPDELVTVLGGSTVTALPSKGRADPGGSLLTGELWFRETRAGSPAWRGGAGAYDAVDGFTWKAARDRRPAVHLKPGEITDVHTENEPNPSRSSWILVLESSSGTVRLAGDRLGEWAVVLHQASCAAREDDGSETTSEVLNGPERG